MLKITPLLAGISCIAFALSAQAQLAANPWKKASPQPTSKIQALGQAQAEQARQVRAAQIQRASAQLQSQRAANMATPQALESQNQAADNLMGNETATVSQASSANAARSGDFNLTPNDGYMGDNVASTDLTKAPAYANSDILPVDPWARARDRSGIKTWRGSGQHGKLNYIGEATTYGENYGQEMIAPEVNRHNMIVLTQHLRNLGYKIPESYDQNIRDLPQNYARQLRAAYNSIGHGNNPFDTVFAGFLDSFEEASGLDVENLLFNSIDLLSID